VIDAHAHLDDRRFPDRGRVIARAHMAGVDRIVSCGGDVTSSQRNFNLAKRHTGVVAAVGVHPHRALEWSALAAQVIEGLAQDPIVVAIGEIGIDHSGRSAPPDAQGHAFMAQLEMARRLDLPAVIHVRDAGPATRALFDRAGGARGMIHCYSEGPAEVTTWLERGMFISFAGNVTYPANGRLREAARLVPRDRILVETDAPYLQPQSRRREPRNEPAFVLETLAAIAEARGEDAAELGEQIAANAAALFGPRWGAPGTA
jgi:TatD DNase family protein